MAQPGAWFPVLDPATSTGCAGTARPGISSLPEELAVCAERGAVFILDHPGDFSPGLATDSLNRIEAIPALISRLDNGLF